MGAKVRSFRPLAVLLFLVLAGGACREPLAPASDRARVGGLASDPQEAERGRQLYEANGCALCHGHEGRGDGPLAPTLEPPPRNFTDANGFQQGTTLAEVATTVQGGLPEPGSTMPAFSHLPLEDTRLIASYVLSLGGHRNDG
jgi:mono/diheme cytochrome c family protein